MADMANIPQAPVTLLDIYTRQVEMNAQLAVIHEQLKTIPDHEQRLRTLETGMPDRLGDRLSGLEGALPTRAGDRLGELEAAAQRRRGSVSVLGLILSVLGSSTAGAVVTLLVTYLLTRHP